MRRDSLRRLAATAGVFMLSAAVALPLAHAQDGFPNRPIRLLDRNRNLFPGGRIENGSGAIRKRSDSHSTINCGSIAVIVGRVFMESGRLRFPSMRIPPFGRGFSRHVGLSIRCG